jgi:alkylated DNA repair dioxygenase AlkB
VGDGQRKPPGLVLLTNFVTEEEEAHLVSILEATDDWKLSKRNGKCEMKNWGIRIDYSAAKPRTRYPNAEEGEKNLPDFFMFLIKRFEQYPPLSAWWPNESNANRYVKSEGHFLTPHFDDRQLSGEIICNVSLLSDCVMTFRRPGSAAEPYRVRLPRFSASVMSRSARFDFTHAIENEDLLGPKRISINFRQQTEPTGVDRVPTSARIGK